MLRILEKEFLFPRSMLFSFMKFRRLSLLNVMHINSNLQDRPLRLEVNFSKIDEMLRI